MSSNSWEYTCPWIVDNLPNEHERKTTDNNEVKNEEKVKNAVEEQPDETVKNAVEEEPEKILEYGENNTVTPAEKTETKAPVKPIKMVTREEWGADPPNRLNPFIGAAQTVRLIFTDSTPCRSKKSCKKAIKKLQRIHMRQGLSDIAYNFLVGGDIRIYEGRGWKEHPGMTDGPDSFQTCEDIVIGYVGSFDDNIEYPEMADKALELVEYGWACGYMTGEEPTSGGQPTETYANTGVDIPGLPEPKYKCITYGLR